MSKHIKKLVAVVVAGIMVATTSPMPRLYATTTAASSTASVAKGTISTILKFDYPFAYAQVKKQNIQVTLLKGQMEVAKISLGETIKEVKNTEGFAITVIPKNLQGVEVTTEDVIGTYEIAIAGVATGTYYLRYEGDGYTDYKTQAIEINNYSKEVIVSTGGSTFAYGDLNHDNLINEADLALLEKAVKEKDGQYDINGDHVVDIVELTYLKQQLIARSQEVQMEGGAIVSTKVLDAVTASFAESGITLTGDVSDLFSGSKAVTITKSEDSDKLAIPLNLGGTIEAQVIEIATPLTTGGFEQGSVEVVYEIDGQEVIETQSFDLSTEEAGDVHLLLTTDQNNTIVINLGKRVPVKRVTITVDKIVGQDGQASYAVVEEISFLKEIVSTASATDKSVIRNVKVVEKNESLELTWDAVANVDGYRVYYSEKSGDYNKELNVNTNAATIKGLDNLKTYYLVVRATSGDWVGTASTEAVGVPQPSAKPLKPDHLKVTAMREALSLNWGKTENATYYKVFYKKASETTYTQYIPATDTTGTGKLTNTSVSIGGLKNGVEYNLYVIAGNNIGESSPSLIANGTPERAEMVGPSLPQLHRISTDEITNVQLAYPSNVDMTWYPNGFNQTYVKGDTQDGIKNVIDNDYATYWMQKTWWVSGQINFTFASAHEMNYVVYVPRLDEEKYMNTLTRYHITVWEPGDDLTKAGKEIVSDKRAIVRTDANGRKYLIFEFPKTNVIKIGVRGRMADGGPALASASEIAFYDYDSIDDEIRALFKDDAYTTLADGVTIDQINDLNNRLNSKDSYYVNTTVLQDEINLAKGLLSSGTTPLGIIKEGLVSINASSDKQTFNTWSPLGIVGLAGKKFTVYADIPDGETVTLIPTQYYAEASGLKGTTIELQKGRNIIDITKIGSLNVTAGGAFYYQYSGSKGDQIKLQIRTIETDSIKKIPTLELYNWYSLTEQERKDKISKYIDELVAYKPASLTNKTANPYNSTEISGRNILLSIPADQALAGIQAAAPTKEQQIEKLYNNLLAWEETIQVTNTTYGLDDPLNALNSRQNIRYMRMFGRAFMYAAGYHIGVGYGSTSALVQGKPTSVTGTTSENALFGWGIAHEIGHNMDRLGKAEITNNIYSLYLQTYNGEDNTLTSRLENSNKYADIYKKVAVGDKGLSNDVFTQLGMYWQLHLAYDNGKTDTTNGPLNFYNQVFKLYDNGSVSQFSGDEKFAVAASMVANKNLTEFFTKWGMTLSDTAKSAMSAYPQEERKIQYFTDNSRRYRLANGTGVQSMTYSATSEAFDEGTKVRITITPDASINTADLLGYEIFRDNKQIAFIDSTTTTYEDVVGAINNKALTYEVRAIDALGKVVNSSNNSGKVSAGQIRIERDNVIAASEYTIAWENTDIALNSMLTTDSALNVASNATGSGAIVITFNKETAVTGLRIRPLNGSTLPQGDFTIQVVNQEKTKLAKQSDFANNAATDTTKFITYFTKPGADATDTRIWTYDAKVLRITGSDIDENFLTQFEVAPLADPGDNVALSDYKVGILKETYTYDGGSIAAGTLIVVGSYRGDPIYNTIHVEGKYAETSGLSDTTTYIERPINGEVLMFAEVPQDGETSDISDGLFIFIPDIQREQELQGDCDAVSALPVEMMAKMYRYDTPDQTGTPRVTSTTTWYATPTYDTMPDIIFNQDNTIQ